LEILSSKKNLRVLQVNMTPSKGDARQFISVNGGMLAQTLDTSVEALSLDMCVTKVKPIESQMKDLDFGWKIVKHVKSNAIAVVKGCRTVGVGAGQTNRVGSAEIALNEARNAGVTEDLVLASDGFLPFDDTVALAARYGVTAIVQPGGSIRDADAIAKADELGITMIFTGVRHFKH
ncbi:MAG TPA: bifunctional phosphoribosylaminoimidazolecarboxamide formyltransferase/inosine monophosphate cyclohydrolase, partial [Rikenellaceae bacterium]|nr:bifunctional phosphoribosylaminoimidazolecarboxamide formyltransferase/inosine monophosphate cyclohydrolase [Rikenellaceae bacterium]